MVALYVRTSTERQSSGAEAQLRALQAWAETKGISDIRVYEDVGISGSKSSRPALDQMLTDCRLGVVKCVVVYSFSRFARSTRHLLGALEEFRALGTSFVSLTEQLDTESPMGRAVFTIISALAQLEREMISNRVKNGLINARAKGRQLGRRRTRDDAAISNLAARGLSQREIGRILKVSKTTVMRSLRAAQNPKESKYVAGT